jgi:hypothetical protein
LATSTVLGGNTIAARPAARTFFAAPARTVPSTPAGIAAGAPLFTRTNNYIEL